MDGAHRVLHRHSLVAGALRVLFGPTQRREDQRASARGHVGMVQLRGDLYRQVCVGQCPLRDLGIRGRPDEVSTHSNEDADFAVPHGTNRRNGVVAVLAGGKELELLVQPVVERLWHFFEDAHGAVALDIRVAADGAYSGSGLADVALEEQHVDDVPERGN
jgi:hypothetical protein